MRLNGNDTLKQVEINDFWNNKRQWKSDGSATDFAVSIDSGNGSSTINFHFTFDASGASISNGDWGFVKAQGNNGDRFQRAIKRDDGYSNASPCVESPPCTPDPAPTFTSVNVNGNPIDICTAVNAGTNTITNYEVTDGVAGPPLDQLDDFAGLADGTRPNFGNWTGVNGSDGTNGWVALSGSTGSNNTGPANGNPDPYVYLESSASNVTYGVGVSAGSSQYLESNTIDASQYSSLSFTFDWNMNVNGNSDASLHVDAWNGSSWDLDITGGPVNTGNNGDVWVTEGPIDLSAYNNTDFKLRIRYVVGTNGNIYQNDVAVDNLHIQGTSAGTTLYSGASCNAVDTTGWTDGSYNLTVTYTDSCGTTNQTATGSGVVNFTACTETATLNAPTFSPATTPITGPVTVT
ncbi:MAG: hypothetical protein D6800_10185, partial [Candidatus Zixiibacteriota bacterium]